MKPTINILLFLFLFTFIGCETMEKGAAKTGEYAGKSTRVVDKVSEGAVDGYIGEDTNNNPYGR